MNTTISEYMKTIGKKGGDKTKQRHPDHYKNAGRLGALKRWGVSKPLDAGTPRDRGAETTKETKKSRRT